MISMKVEQIPFSSPWASCGGSVWKRYQVYRAPLLLVPVTIERKSASSRFTLHAHEDEPRFNSTLLQFLEREFDLRLPQFSGELPTDGSGIDVPRLLASMRQAVRDVPGMEVIDDGGALDLLICQVPHVERSR